MLIQINPSIFDNRAFTAVVSAGSETANRWFGVLTGTGTGDGIDASGPSAANFGAGAADRFDPGAGLVNGISGGSGYLYDEAESRLRSFNMYDGDYVEKRRSGGDAAIRGSALIDALRKKKKK